MAGVSVCAQREQTSVPGWPGERGRTAPSPGHGGPLGPASSEQSDKQREAGSRGSHEERWGLCRPRTLGGEAIPDAPPSPPRDPSSRGHLRPSRCTCPGCRALQLEPSQPSHTSCHFPQATR